MSAPTFDLGTLHGGLRLTRHKTLSTSQPILRMPVPAQLVLPITQHVGEATDPVVGIGEKVLKGQLVAKIDGGLGAPVHASSSGTVVAIEPWPVSRRGGDTAPCIVIETDGQDTPVERCEELPDFRSVAPDVLRARILQCGIVGLGGAVFPTAQKLSQARATNIHSLILNGVECEPYISCDDMLMREHANEVLTGAQILLRALEIDRCIVAIESDKPEAINRLTEELALIDDPRIVIKLVPTIYPSGGEDQLVQLVTNLEVPTGGQHKTLATVENIYSRLIESGFDRSGTIVALGGAVISELAGFVAATYMRGVDCVQCPTSLLSMVDSSIGGKAGVDLPEGQNLIGAFKQPKVVIADVATLQSLPAREFASGMAEIIKHSLIADSDLLDQIEKGHWRHKTTAPLPAMAELQALVAQAIQVKIHIVQEDPFDEGPRQVLNLGHTFAHAIEQVSGNSVRHGEAVAMGLVAAANLSARLGYCSTALQTRIESVVGDADLPVRIPPAVDARHLMAAMGRDKKKADGRIRFVLLRDIGDVFVTDSVTEADVMKTLESLGG